MIPTAILIGLACLFILALIEPQFARFIASKLLGWAEAWEQFPRTRREATDRWNKQLGIAEDRPVLVRRERA